MFGRQQSPSSRLSHTILRSSIGIVCFMLVGVGIYRLVTIKQTISHIVATKQAAGYEHLLQTIYPLDSTGVRALGSLLPLVNQQNTPVASLQQLINTLVQPLQEKNGALFTLFSRFFPRHAGLLHDLSFFSDDISSLLGEEKPQTYLIVLQNSAEKRPNGGFFGSFALVTFTKGKIQNIEVIDSYHPAYNRPTTKILGPIWLERFLPERDIYFVGANKVGFTYHDGANIKTLYEKSYPGKKLRGVIFLRTDMFTRLLPGFTEELWHWQYLNASVNLIKGGEKRGRKDLYVRSLDTFLKKNLRELLTNLWIQLPDLIEQRYINIYLEKISGPFHTFLRTHTLTTRFEDDHAYFRDSNIVFNKSDTFVQKTIRLLDMTNEQLGEWSGDIVKLPQLGTGNMYIFEISYTLAVPEHYHEFIRKLNSTYGITLTEREEHILALNDERGSRGNVYFPPYITVIGIDGDVSSKWTFETPFSHNAAYEATIHSNMQTHTIRIQVIVE